MNTTPSSQPSGNVDTQDSVTENITFSNSARIVDRLRSERVGIKNLMAHLEEDRGATLQVRIRLVQIVRSVESGRLSPSQIQQLTLLESYLRRQELNTPEEIERNRNPELESVLENLINEAIGAKNSLIDSSSTMVQDTSRTGIDIVAGGASSVLSRISSSPDSVKIGVLAGLGVALYFIAKSPGLRRSLITGLGLAGAVMLVKPITGRSLPEWIDRWIDRVSGNNSNRAYADYFGLDYTNEASRNRINLLIESFSTENNFSRRNFKDIVESYNSSTEHVPQSLLSGTAFSSVPRDRQPAVMRDAIGIIIDKYGPGTDLYRNNADIREKWNELNNGNISWREGIRQLFRLDPASPSYNAGIQNPEGTPRMLVVESSNSVTLTNEHFNSISAGLPSSTSSRFRESVVNGLNSTKGNGDQGFINRWLNRRVANTQELDSFSPPLGTKLNTARSNPSNFTYADGLFLGSYVFDLNSSEITLPEKRSEMISEAISNFYNSIKGHNNYSEGGLFDLLYGAETRQSDTGQYYVALSYRIPNRNADATSLVDRTAYYSDNTNFPDRSGFRLNYFQRAELKNLYQAQSWTELDTILDDIRRNYVTGTMLTAEFARTRLMTEEFRDIYFARNQQAIVNNIDNATTLNSDIFRRSTVEGDPLVGLRYANLSDARLSEEINLPAGTVIKFRAGTVLRGNLNHRSFLTNFNVRTEPNTASPESQIERTWTAPFRATVQSDSFYIADGNTPLPSGLIITGGIIVFKK